MGEQIKKAGAQTLDLGFPDEAELALHVLRALEEDVVVPHPQIRASVSNGVVTLEGRVDLWRQYDDAERAVRNVPSVRDVRNKLAVEPSSAPAPRHPLD